ncbi:leucine-rich repeat domain-containing protein [Agaribacterium haliotis]|uniref:leucine-rich repeat domain-containing protein n=1 Tax=Agaribacterium haliotis TaxID=2013869 RepID=UPI000BB57250|nr:leucine-rich repeat domain-containing protein [Agaribacterium haliotis]
MTFTYLFRRPLRLFFFFLCSGLSLGACSNYEWSLNDRVVYTPPPLFNDYDKSDLALAKCLRQTIEAQQISAATQLSELRCPPGEIHSVQALGIFQKLTTLGLGDNQIKDASSLAALPKLRFLDLRGNNKLDCTSLSAIDGLSDKKLDTDGSSETAKNGGVKIERPAHCY